MAGKPSTTGLPTEAERWRAPSQCPGKKTAGNRPTPVPPEPPTAQQILADAYELGNDEIQKALPEIRLNVGRMIDAYTHAATTLLYYREFIATRLVGAGFGKHLRVLARHEHDGPEDRRRKPWWASDLIASVAILVSAVYDTVFLGGVLRHVLDAQPWSAEAYIAYLPGLGIALGLLVTGHLLSTAYARHAARADRRPGRHDAEADPDDLPRPRWAGAVILLFVFLGTLSLWAYIRAIQPDAYTFDSELYGWQLAVLIMLTTLAALALKMVANNPYAIDAREAGDGLAAARADGVPLRAAASAAVAEHSKLWVEVELLVSAVQARSQTIVEAGSADVLDLETLTSNQKLHLELLTTVRDVCAEYPPGTLVKQLASADAALRRQWGPGDPEDADPGQAGSQEEQDGPARP